MRWSPLVTLVALVASTRATLLGTRYIASSSLAPSAVPYTRFSHINYVGASIAANGALIGLDAARLAEMVTLAHEAGVKVSLVIGGTGSAKHLLAQLSSTSDALVKSLVTTATVHSVDGLQVELHDTRADCGAVTAEDVDHLRALFESLRSKLGSGFHLGITVPGMVFPGVTNARALAAALDDITIMGQDIITPASSELTGPSAPLLTCAASVAPTSVDAALQLWRHARVPYGKMTLSVPTYGYRYEGVNRLTKSTRSAFISHAYNPFKALASVAADKCAIDVRGRVTFAELVSEGKVHANGLKGRGSYIRYFDTCTSTPFLFSPKDKTFVAYDDPQSVNAKAAYVKRIGLAGLSFSDIAGDAKHLLLEAAREGFTEKAAQPAKQITLNAKKSKMVKKPATHRRPH